MCIHIIFAINVFERKQSDVFLLLDACEINRVGGEVGSFSLFLSGT